MGRAGLLPDRWRRPGRSSGTRAERGGAALVLEKPVFGPGDTVGDARPGVTIGHFQLLPGQAAGSGEVGAREVGVMEQGSAEVTVAEVAIVEARAG